MHSSQNIMRETQGSAFWRDNALIKEAAGQADSIEWRLKQEGNPPLLVGAIETSSLSQGWHWHYADAVANADSELSFVSEPGVTAGVAFAGYLNVDVGGTPRLIDASKTPIAFCFSHPKRVTLKRRFRRGDSVHKFTLTLSSAWLAKTGVEPHQIVDCSGLSQFPASAELCNKIQRIVTNDADDSLTQRFQSMRYVLDIVEAFSIQLGASQKTSTVKSIDQKLLSLADLLINDSSLMLDDLRVIDIAQKLGFSESKLQRLANKHFGMPLLQYIRKKRLIAAHHALVNLGLSVGECAFIAGYKHPSNFAIAFKKMFTFAPGEFQRDKGSKKSPV